MRYVGTFLLSAERTMMNYAYRRFDQPVYRGTKAPWVRLENYNLWSIGFWKTFSSTSKNFSVAENFMQKSEPGESNGVIFEIYLSPSSTGHTTNIEVNEAWGTVKGEQEVLLLPYFTFVVARKEVVQKPSEGISYHKITVVEVPDQSLLKQRLVAPMKLIWADLNMRSQENA